MKHGLGELIRRQGLTNLLAIVYRRTKSSVRFMSTTILEFKVKGKKEQFVTIKEAIRTALFVRNKCLRLWMDGKGVNQ